MNETSGTRGSSRILLPTLFLPLRTGLQVSTGVMVAFYFIFEIWFKVPLPKGPIEAFLGLD